MQTVEAKVIDATHIELLTPIAAEQGRRVLVILDAEADREEWLAASACGLARAYGEGEPEYTEDMVREANPEYRP